MANKFIWDLSDLHELKTLDSLAFRAEGIQRPQAKLIGAVTYHWELVGEKLVDNEISVGDYSIFGSTSKGITAHLLSEYRYRHMRVYRPRMAPGQQDALKELALKRYYYYGDQRYDHKGVIMVASWCLLRKAGFEVEWWEHNSHSFWCLEFNDVILRDVWQPVIPIDEPAYPYNMENSPYLELIWGTF